MNKPDPLERFERLVPRLREERAPAVHVVPQVMRRVRRIEGNSERALALFAAASCVFAAVVVAVGLSLLWEAPDPMGALFQIVPPIEL